MLTHDLLEFCLGIDPNPVRVTRSRQLGWVDAALDVRDLRRREGDDGVLRAASVEDVEVVEVAACRTDDEDPAHCIKHMQILRTECTEHGVPARAGKAHCVQAASGRYMCSYVVARNAALSYRRYLQFLAAAFCDFKKACAAACWA